MTDRILTRFLDRQNEDGLALARQSDLVDLVPVGPAPFSRYVVQLRCTGLLREPTGTIAPMTYSEASVAFPPDYLRRVQPYQIVEWLGPRNAWHPNISSTAPVVCRGRLSPGTNLTEILFQLFEIVTYQRYATHDALNREAAAWARQHQDKLPVDRRGLKWRSPAAPGDARAAATDDVSDRRLA